MEIGGKFIAVLPDRFPLDRSMVERGIVDQDRSEQRLLGFDVVRHHAMLLDLRQFQSVRRLRHCSRAG